MILWSTFSSTASTNTIHGAVLPKTRCMSCAMPPTTFTRSNGTSSSQSHKVKYGWIQSHLQPAPWGSKSSKFTNLVNLLKVKNLLLFFANFLEISKFCEKSKLHQNCIKTASCFFAFVNEFLTFWYRCSIFPNLISASLLLINPACDKEFGWQKKIWILRTCWYLLRIWPSKVR